MFFQVYKNFTMRNCALQYMQRQREKTKTKRKKEKEKSKEKSKDKEKRQRQREREKQREKQRQREREKQRQRELAKYVLFIPVNAKHIENIFFYGTIEKNRKYMTEVLNVILMLRNG